MTQDNIKSKKRAFSRCIFSRLYFLRVKVSKRLVLHSKVAVKGLGREKKRLQQNIVDLFPDIRTIPGRWGLRGEWT